MKISLNILPDNRKVALLKRRVLFRFGIGIVSIGTLILILDVFLVGIVWSMHRYESSVFMSNQKMTEEQVEELRSFEALFLEKNQEMSIVHTIAKDQRNYGLVMDTIAKIIPEKVMIESIILSKDSVIIHGIANVRDAVLRFQEAVDQENCFFSANVPIENLVQRENVRFELAFSLEDSCFFH